MSLTIDLFGPIGSDLFLGEGVTAARVAEALRAGETEERISLRVNSPGGDVFEALAIRNLLIETGKPIEATIEGLAASAASAIVTAAQRIVMGEGAMMMIHRASGMAWGSADDLRRTAAALEKVDGELAAMYSARSGMSIDRALELMAAETWFTGEEAVAAGLADEVSGDAVSDAASDAAEETSGPAARLAASLGWKRPPRAALQRLAALAPVGAQDRARECDGDSHDFSNANAKGANAMREEMTTTDEALAAERARIAAIAAKARELDLEDLGLEHIAAGTAAAEAIAALQDAKIAQLRGAAAPAPGPDEASEGATAIDVWERELRARMAAGATRAAAVRQIVRERPDVWRRYVEAFNRLHAGLKS